MALSLLIRRSSLSLSKVSESYCGLHAKPKCCGFPVLREQRRKMSSNSSVLVQVLSSSVAIVDRAGEIVRDVLRKGQLGIVEKTGADDLQTQADRSAQNCILASLAAQYPGLKVVGEEGELDMSQVEADWVVNTQDPEALKVSVPAQWADVRLEDLTVWVDPLDGTKEFTQGLLDHVTVLVGIAVGSEAVAGVIHQPYYNYQAAGQENSLGRTFYGLQGVGVSGISPRPPPADRVITTTRSHGTGLVQDALDILKPDKVLKVGGAGHKVILLMEGEASAYVFPSPGCKKWDTCAPEAILHAMGGLLTDIHGNKYEYHAGVEQVNMEGVLATARLADHAWYVETLPQTVKDQVKHSLRKKK